MSAMRQAEMVCDSDQILMLLGVKARGVVKGRLLAMSLQQRFRNSSDTSAEINYTFPLPFGAVMMGVDVELNGKQLKGEVIARSAARAQYEEAISEGNSSIMLERNVDQSYSLELGNLMAREECCITIRYAQVLPLDQGQIRLMLPTTIAPRYGNPIIQGGLQPHQTAETNIFAQYPFEISLTLHGDLAKAKVASPSHSTGYHPQGDDIVVHLAQQGAMDRDFILTISDLQNQSSATSCADAFVEGQTALMVNFNPKLDDGAAKPILAKILVDCSGSMAGDSIAAARSALHRIIAGLETADRFSLSRFGSTVEHRSRGMWSATAQAKASAKRWIDGVDANLGGTEMADALTSTIGISQTGKCDILLITDGEIEGIDDVIKLSTRSGHRVFVVGIGASPAEIHLRRLAAATGGACDFVAPGEDAEPAVLRMFSRLRSSRASQLRVQWPVSMQIKWAQETPGSTFANDAVTLCAFAQTKGMVASKDAVQLWGRLDDASGEVLLAEADVVPVESTFNPLARVAAFAQYAQISATEGSLDASAEVSRSQALAVQYQLVTDETNFILVHARDASDKALEMPELHKVVQMMPAGWGGTGSAQFSRMNKRMQFSISADLSGMTVPCSNKPAANDYASMATPSVWRTGRGGGAEVDALSPGAMDDYEIPAFLRKQDHHVHGDGTRFTLDENGITPVMLSAWLTANTPSQWPHTFLGLRDLDLAQTLCDWLELVVGQGKDEASVVRAFIAVVLEYQFSPAHGIRKTVQSVKGVMHWNHRPGDDLELSTAIRAGLQGMQASRWPDAVLHYPVDQLE